MNYTATLLQLQARTVARQAISGWSYNEILHFRLYALRFQFAAQGRLEFRAGQAVNLVRGGLGAALRKTSCPSACLSPDNCPQHLPEKSPGQPSACPYHRLFEPRANGSGPSGLADWPRPFVLRAAHLEGATIAEGAFFHIGVHLFDLRPGAVPALEAALARWGRDGLGPERTAAMLSNVEGATQPLELMLDSSADPVSRITVRFLTPTELKGPWGGPPEPQGGIRRGLQPGRRAPQRLAAGAGLPPFELLAVRIRDRLSTLRALYGEGALPIDFRGFAERAARVRTVGGAVREVAVQRRSRRTGQTHSLGGFIGEVEYEGDLAEFLPYLRAAAFTGVGRHTVWGKGEIHVVGRVNCRVDGVD